MIYAFDLDNTICSQNRADYSMAQPWHKRIDWINNLYDKGHTIKIFTARGSTTGIDHRTLTERQLKHWGLKYHELIFGKPHFDIYICDKSMNAEQYFRANLNEY